MRSMVFSGSTTRRILTHPMLRAPRVGRQPLQLDSLVGRSIVALSTNGGNADKDTKKKFENSESSEVFTQQHPLEKRGHASTPWSEPVWDHPVPHQVYDLDKINNLPMTHHDPSKINDRVAYFAVKTVRKAFDILSGYRGPGGAMTETDWLRRVLFLETIAGVPGMVGGMARHLRSLRSMRRDYGWIHTLLEEAENERMHLMIFMNMKQPGLFFRLMVLGAQGVFFNMFFVSYLISPRTCHRFVGYLEEEAVKTYTGLLKDIDDGHLKHWESMQAPAIARNYYKLPDEARVHDMIKCIRADEANHRDVNHTFAGLDQKKGVNPFVHGQEE